MVTFAVEYTAPPETTAEPTATLNAAAKLALVTPAVAGSIAELGDANGPPVTSSATLALVHVTPAGALMPKVTLMSFAAPAPNA